MAKMGGQPSFIYFFVSEIDVLFVALKFVRNPNYKLNIRGSKIGPEEILFSEFNIYIYI
jgi:hypothetical protein